VDNPQIADRLDAFASVLDATARRGWPIAYWILPSWRRFA